MAWYFWASGEGSGLAVRSARMTSAGRTPQPVRIKALTASSPLRGAIISINGVDSGGSKNVNRPTKAVHAQIFALHTQGGSDGQVFLGIRGGFGSTKAVHAQTFALHNQGGSDNRALQVVRGGFCSGGSKGANRPTKAAHAQIFALHNQGGSDNRALQVVRGGFCSGGLKGANNQRRTNPSASLHQVAHCQLPSQGSH